MAPQLFSYANPFVHDAFERVHAADVAIARSMQSLAISRAYFAITQLKISQSEVLISAADRLIVVLEREIVSRPDSASAASNVDCLQEN